MTQGRIISRKVLGSANPFARKYRDIKQAFAGIGCGFVAIILGFVLVYASVKMVKENSKIVNSLTLQSAESVAPDETGMVKIQGVPSVTNQKIFTYTKCFDTDCEWEGDEKIEIENALYLDASFERYEVVKEMKTRTYTRVENGQDVEYTEEYPEYTEKWVEKKTDSFWSEFKLGNIGIIPDKAKRVVDLQKEEIPNVYIANLGPVQTFAEHAASSQVGSTRLVVNYLPNTKELIVVGNLGNSKIEGGETFIISDKPDEELTTALKTEEKTMKIGLLVGAWLLLTIGFSAIIAPVMEFVEIIPILGNMTKFVAGIAGALLSAFIVVTLWVFFKFWYLICGLIVLMIAGLIFLLIAYNKKREENKPEKEEK